MAILLPIWQQYTQSKRLIIIEQLSPSSQQTMQCNSLPFCGPTKYRQFMGMNLPPNIASMAVFCTTTPKPYCLVDRGQPSLIISEECDTISMSNMEVPISESIDDLLYWGTVHEC